MPKKSVSARHFFKDLRDGWHDEELKSMYGITDQGLEAIFVKLLELGILNNQEVLAWRMGTDRDFS